jgi:alpha-beta hydrolase superfamily lysophospholipase
MKLLQRKFPNLSLQMIAGAGHHMVNEAPALREEIFAALKF